MATGGAEAARGGFCMTFYCELKNERPLEKPSQPEEDSVSLLIKN